MREIDEVVQELEEAIDTSFFTLLWHHGLSLSVRSRRWTTGGRREDETWNLFTVSERRNV